MDTVLLTGGAGFFGDILKQRLLRDGFRVVSIDLEKDQTSHPHLISIQGNICDRDLMTTIFREHRFSAVFHLAAILAHAVKDKNFLWQSNVEGTRVLAECMVASGVRKVIFTSSNCLWGKGMGRPIREDDRPNPIEIYGRSKLAAEKILLECPALDAVIFRCPTIMDAGRLGLLSILFTFIEEGRKVWVVGGGKNRYQFIYGQDLVDACLLALGWQGRSEIFNIGSDSVRSFREIYTSVISRANTGARVVALPKNPTLFLMNVAHLLGLSPLGPYQYKMIAEDFEFDTRKIKEMLKWKPTVTNEDMLWKAYEYYHAHRNDIAARTDVSAHRRPAMMGIIRLLKWLS